MSVWAIIPAKDPSLAKSRLARQMSPEARRVFALRTLEHVIVAAMATPAIDQCVVVSAAEEPLAVAARHGATPLRELPDRGEAEDMDGNTGIATECEGGRPEMALNRALEQARRLAVAEGASALLVMAADLPLVSSAALGALIACIGAGNGIALAPDRHGTGTNALVMRPPQAMPFAFGPGSLQRHRRLALQNGIEARLCRLDGLALDIDTIEDVRAFVQSQQSIPAYERCAWFGIEGVANMSRLLAHVEEHIETMCEAEDAEEKCANGI